MNEIGYPPKLDDFASRPWEEVVNSSKGQDRFAYCSEFCARTAREVDAVRKNVWLFLARVTTNAFDLETPSDPFGSIVDDFSDEEIELMKALITEVVDPELRARMADIIWTRQGKGNYPFVKIAIESYLKSARRLEYSRNGVEGADRTERACQLAFSLNNTEIRESVILHIEEWLIRCGDEVPSYVPARMMRLLLGQKTGDHAKYSQLAEKLAKSAALAKEYGRAKDYWELKASWHRLGGDEKNARLASIEAAETHVLLAQSRLEQTAAPYLHAWGHLQSAIEAYRRIPDTQERVRDLHRLMLEYQKKSVSELSHFEVGPVDLTEAAEEAKRRVKDKSLYDALFALANLLGPTKVSYVRKQAERSAKDFAFLSLFPSSRLNAMGKVVARQPSLRANSPEEAKEAMQAKMYENASIFWNLNAQGRIEPARRQIISEHNLRVRDFSVIISDNPLVPHGREVLYARGLHAGMVGDFVFAVHLLIPQIEHSVRCVLYDNEAIVSGIKTGGIQHEYNLNTTLKDSRYVPTLENLFGVDTIFDLRGLLVEPHGANLRNEMAHGLLDSNQFYSSAVRYLWWLTLRLCCIPFFNRLAGEPQSGEESEGESSQKD